MPKKLGKRLNVVMEVLQHGQLSDYCDKCVPAKMFANLPKLNFVGLFFAIQATLSVYPCIHVKIYGSYFVNCADL